MGLRHPPPESGSCTSQSASKFYGRQLRQTANVAYNLESTAMMFTEMTSSTLAPGGDVDAVVME